MGRYRVLLVAALFIVAILSSCVRDIEIDSVEKELFLGETELGCYKDGHDYMVYNPEMHQLAVNPKRHTVRIQSESQKDYCHLDMESYPRSIGVGIVSEFHISLGGSEDKYTFVFECSKMEYGKIWLWNKENKLGIIIPVH
jgi:hypothetical protein